MGKFVDAVNSRGEKQRVPERWLGHPVLGKGLRLAPSEAARKTSTTTDSGGSTPPAGKNTTDETAAAAAKE